MKTRNHAPVQVLFVSVAFALAWRLLAVAFPSSFIDIEDAFLVPLAILGTLFLGCGVYVSLRAWNESTKVFFLYCFGSAIHWGGSIGHPVNAGDLWLAIYVTLSALADGALLHLALVFPTQLVTTSSAKVPAYIPAGMAMLLIPLSTVLARHTFSVLAGATLLLASIVSLIAGIVIIAQYFHQERAVRRALKLDLVIFGGITSTALGLTGSSGLLPGEVDAWNLLFGVLPVTLAVALTSVIKNANRTSG